MPKVSICIPAYKQVEYLRNTLDSIRVQDYTDYEVILTDDSPDDSVWDLVNHYDFNGRLKYHRNARALGSPGNWNAGIGMATGEYVKIMHHDHYFTYENSLSAFVGAIEKDHLDFVFSACINKVTSTNEVWKYAAGKQQIRELERDPRCLFLGNFIGAPSVTMYKRLSGAPFDVRLKWLVDVDFYITYLTGNRKVGFIEDPLVTVIGAEHNVTNECGNIEVEITEYIYLYNKIFKKVLIPGRRILGVFRRLLQTYHIESFEEIKDWVHERRMALLLKFLIRFNSVKRKRTR